jgi:hypothetical protein
MEKFDVFGGEGAPRGRDLQVAPLDGCHWEGGRIVQLQQR